MMDETGRLQFTPGRHPPLLAQIGDRRQRTNAALLVRVYIHDQRTAMNGITTRLERIKADGSVGAGTQRRMLPSSEQQETITMIAGGQS